MSLTRIAEWMLNQTATVERYDGEGGYGPTFAAGVDVKCRLEGARKMVTNREGNTVVSAARLFLAPEADITVESKVTCDGDNYIVLSVAKQPGPGGQIHHIDALLGIQRAV